MFYVVKFWIHSKEKTLREECMIFECFSVEPSLRKLSFFIFQEIPLPLRGGWES